MACLNIAMLTKSLSKRSLRRGCPYLMKLKRQAIRIFYAKTFIFFSPEISKYIIGKYENPEYHFRTIKAKQLMNAFYKGS